MTGQRATFWAFLVSSIGAAFGPFHIASFASEPPTASPAPSAQARLPQNAHRVEASILQALASNPVTSPYHFSVVNRGGTYALSGRVGTKQVHDAAIRTLIGMGYSVRDDLTIDTGETYRVAAMASGAGGGMAPGVYPGGGAPAASVGAGAINAPALGMGAVPYVYPPPLFGRLDDPFFGLEPPLVSYAPWYRAVTAREPIGGSAANAMNPGAGALVPPQAEGVPPQTGANGAENESLNLRPDEIEMTLDRRGVAVLRGRVPTLADRVAIGQKIAATPGISQVLNLLQVGGVAANPSGDGTEAAGAANPPSETPPPPPTPASRSTPRSGTPAQPHTAEPPSEGAAIRVEGDSLSKKVAESLSRRPRLATLPLKVTARDGVATLTGRVPSAYEALLAFRAAQQTPGVREVIDRMEFPIPDAGAANPLRDKGRPSDVEPYLLSQIRRQVGDLAHVDEVRVHGDTLEISGTLAKKDDNALVEATLRSIPLLRGFRLEPHFETE